MQLLKYVRHIFHSCHYVSDCSVNCLLNRQGNITTVYIPWDKTSACKKTIELFKPRSGKATRRKIENFIKRILFFKREVFLADIMVHLVWSGLFKIWWQGKVGLHTKPTRWRDLLPHRFLLCLEKTYCAALILRLIFN